MCILGNSLLQLIDVAVDNYILEVYGFRDILLATALIRCDHVVSRVLPRIAEVLDGVCVSGILAVRVVDGDCLRTLVACKYYHRVVGNLANEDILHALLAGVTQELATIHRYDDVIVGS